MSIYDFSVELSQPIYLYAFTLEVDPVTHATRTWRYASSATNVLTPDGFVWYASALSHDGVKQTGEAASDSLSIEGTIDLAPAQIYIVNPPATLMTATIFAADANDLDYATIYAGEIQQVDVPEIGKCVIKCATISVSLERAGVRLSWQRSCPYTLYDDMCGIDKAAHEFTSTITAINGFDVTIASFAGSPGFYDGGVLTYTHPVKGVQMIGIEAQITGGVKLFGAMSDMIVGMQVKIAPGCARTPTACQAFSNYDNYGGVPNMPGKSPFDGINPFF